LSGSRLATLRRLVPQIGVFGGAGGGTIISGALMVGKVVPHLADTVRITGVPSKVTRFTATQLEAYTRRDDSDLHDFADVVPVESDARLEFDEDGAVRIVGGRQMQFVVETFPAGTTFSAWLTLNRPTDLELAFFVDVLAAYAAAGRLGGRGAIGHGLLRADLVPDHAPEGLPDWRAFVVEHRDEVLDALGTLT